MDVMKIARERREALVDQITDLKTEIAKLDDFMELAEEIASGKPLDKPKSDKSAKADKEDHGAKAAKVTDFNANIFAPAEEAKAS